MMSKGQPKKPAKNNPFTEDEDQLAQKKKKPKKKVDSRHQEDTLKSLLR